MSVHSDEPRSQLDKFAVALRNRVLTDSGRPYLKLLMTSTPFLTLAGTEARIC